MKEKGFLKGALSGALAMLLVFGVVSCSIRTGNDYQEDESTESAGEVVSLQSEIKLSLLRTLIDGHYTGDVDEDALTEGLYKGYVASLGDPYSVYYDEEETAELNESTSGEYKGIGVVMSQDAQTGVITVLQVYEDSPAMEAGMKDGDILYKVDGEDVSGQELSEVVGRIRGEEHTTVDITVLRGETGSEVELTVERRTIQVQTVSSEMKEDGIGYIRVTEFDEVTYNQYEEALNDLESQGMKGLVVDLRSNPGGNLNIVCDMLDLMLPEGLCVYMEDKNGLRTEFSSDEEHQFTKPLVVLMDGYSASASEIYAGAIQDYGIGQIVGTQSYGKGVVQQVFDLQDNTSVKLTIAKYYTPNGRCIDGEGITPDVEIEYEPDEEHPEADNQLEKALEILRGEI